MPATRPAWLRAGQGEKFRGDVIAPQNHTLNFSPREIGEALAQHRAEIPTAIYEGLVRSLGSEARGGVGGKGQAAPAVDMAKLKSLELASKDEEMIIRQAMPFSDQAALIALSMAQSINLGTSAKER